MNQSRRHQSGRQCKYWAHEHREGRERNLEIWCGHRDAWPREIVKYRERLPRNFEEHRERLPRPVEEHSERLTRERAELREGLPRKVGHCEKSVEQKVEMDAMTRVTSTWVQ